MNYSREAMEKMMAADGASGAAGAVAGWKLLTSLAGGAGIAAGLATFVVMCAKRPRDDQEWRVALISTVMSSFGGGAWVLIYFNLLPALLDKSGVELYVSVVAIIGLVFACGLPGWAIVRGIFTYLAKQEGKGIDESINDLKGLKP